MKNKNQKLILGSVFVMLALFGAAFVAAQGLGLGGGMSDEDRAAMQEAMQNGDYETWSSLGKAQFSEERFAEMQERQAEMQAHREAVEAALDSGDYDAWVAAMADAPGNHGMMDAITEENFDTFVEMHQAREAGDFDTASELAEELGLGVGSYGGCDGVGAGFGGNGVGQGKGMRMHAGF